MNNLALLLRIPLLFVLVTGARGEPPRRATSMSLRRR